MIFILSAFVLILIAVSFLLFKKFFNPFFVGAFTALLSVVFMPQLRVLFLKKESFFLTDLIIGTYLVCFFIGTTLRIPTLRYKVPERDSRIIWFTLLVLLFLAPILLSNFINYPLTFEGFRKFYLESRFDGMGFFFTATSNLILLLVLLFIHQRKFKWALLITPFLILFGQKILLLNLILGTLVIMEYEFLIKTSRIILFLIVGILALLFVHYLSRVGIQTSPLYYAIEYFDYYDNLTLLVKEIYVNHTFELFRGEILLGDFYRLVPRFIWNDKPEVYSYLLIHQRLFPSELAAGYTPSFFEPIAAPLADFGILGVCIFGLFKGILTRFIFNMYLKSDKNFILLYLFLFLTNIFSVVYSLLLLLLNALHIPKFYLRNHEK